MATEQLTARQQKVYEFIRDKIRGRGYGPTVREIGEAFEIRSPNGVMCHLRALEKKGLIRRQPNKSRAIELIRGARRRRGLPLAGRVAAGATMLAEEQKEWIDFGELFDGPETFVLEVTGDSMIDAHIQDGDCVVVRRAKSAAKGDIVVALVDGEATLKYWYPERSKRRIRLQPANSSMEPIFVKEATVLGIVEGVVRKMH